MDTFGLKQVDLEKGSVSVLEKGSGRPFVLLNGFPFGACEFRDVVEALSWSSRAVCVDVPGIVRSGLAGDGGAGAFADLLLYFFAKAGLDCFVLGATDIAGPVACELIRKAGGMISGLLLWNTSVRPGDTRTPGYLQTPRTTVVNLLNPGARIVNEIVKVMAAAGNLDDGLVSCAKANLDRQSRKAAMAAFTRLLGPSAADYTETLAQFRKPLALCWGADDRVCPVSNAAVVLNAVPGLKAGIWEGAGHFLGIEKPGELAQALQDLGHKAWC